MLSPAIRIICLKFALLANTLKMLIKKFRLPVKNFLEKKPKIIKTENFSFKYLPNRLSYSRIGVVVSKKIEKTAVKRNKIKRIIFDLFTPKEKTIKFYGVDILILPNKKILTFGKKEIKKELQKEIKLIKDGLPSL